jgi:PLP dependent protein
MSAPVPLASAPAPAVVAARVDDIRRRISESGRDPATVRLVAVTKGFDGTAVAAALAAGVGDIGENYAAELISKASSLGDESGHAVGDAVGSATAARWHFLGAIQRRKIRDLAPHVGCWQTIARAVEGEEIARRTPGAGVFVEVEVSGLPGRNGCPPAEVAGLVRTLRGLDLDVRGLMVVAPPGTAEVARTAFRTTAALAGDLGLDELSMGMTQDFEVALEEGSTMMRVGRALFGARPETGRGIPEPRSR